MQLKNKNQKIAIWAVTPKGANLAKKLGSQLLETDVYVSKSLKKYDDTYKTFDRLSHVLSEVFHKYKSHIFIMSTGIVVRMIAPYIQHKTTDPGVVVMDELGLYAISLLSGHIGGANDLTIKVGKIIGANPVITTATDINKIPSIDILAKKQGLFIENPDCIKYISMALLTGQKIWLHDPFGFMKNILDDSYITKEKNNDIPGVFIDDIINNNLCPKTLILRPASLTAGMGCNRSTSMKEMKALLLETLEKFQVSPNSLKTIASVDIKQDESGLIELGKELNISLTFFDRQSLKQVKNIQNPSAMVEKHIGVQSVCEAAAILAANKGQLIIPKHNTKNVTVAVARIPFTS